MINQGHLDKLANLWNKTKDPKYKRLWYKLVRSIDGHNSFKRRNVPTTTNIKTDPGWNSVDKRNKLS
jgi:hypothetical protein